MTGIGNGYCNIDNNKPECNYDGGDCCECTCDPSQGDDDNACTEFACIDPSAGCVDDDDITADMLENCYVSGRGRHKIAQSRVHTKNTFHADSYTLHMLPLLHVVRSSWLPPSTGAHIVVLILRSATGSEAQILRPSLRDHIFQSPRDSTVSFVHPHIRCRCTTLVIATATSKTTSLNATLTGGLLRLHVPT